MKELALPQSFYEDFDLIRYKLIYKIKKALTVADMVEMSCLHGDAFIQMVENIEKTGEIGIDFQNEHKYIHYYLEGEPNFEVGDNVILFGTIKFSGEIYPDRRNKKISMDAEVEEITSPMVSYEDVNKITGKLEPIKDKLACHSVIFRVGDITL
jgi:hypothetical protein